MNKPYVKEFDSKGLLLNPIVGSYKSTSPNRMQRRELQTNKPFVGNKKGISLVVVKIGALSFQKYKKMVQVINMPDGSKKRINQSYLVN